MGGIHSKQSTDCTLGLPPCEYLGWCSKYQKPADVPADKVQFTVEIFEALIVTCIQSLMRDVPECHAHRVKGYFEQFTAQNQENDFLRFLKNASCFNYKMIGSKTLRKRIVNYTLQVLREQVSNDDTFIETMTDELNDHKNDSLVRQCGSDIFTSDYVKSQVRATGKTMRIGSPRSPSRFPNVLPRTNP